MIRSLGPCVLAALSVLPTAASSGQAPAELVWQDRIDIATDRDQPSHVVATSGYLVADGWSLFRLQPGQARRDRVTHVNAYDLATGELLWHQGVEANGSGNLLVDGRVVLLVSSGDFAIWAFDLETGQPLWQVAETVPESRLQVSALADGTLFTAGYWRPKDAPEFAFLLQAHDVRSGALLWEDRGPALPHPRFPGVAAIAAQNGLVSVVWGEASGPLAHAITTYDAITGSRLWDRPFAENEWGFDNDLALCRGRLFVAFTRSDRIYASPHTYVVRALDARTGETLWERAFTEEQKTGYSAEGLLCAGPNAYAAARSDAPNTGREQAAFLWALDRKRGETRWQRQFSGDLSFSRLQRLEAGTVLYRLDDQLQAYARRSGKLLWETAPFAEGGWIAVDLAPNGHLAVAGSVTSKDTKSDIIVRVLR